VKLHFDRCIHFHRQLCWQKGKLFSYAISHPEFNHLTSSQCFSSVIKNARDSKANSCCCRTLFRPLRKCVLGGTEIFVLPSVYQLEEDFTRDAFECYILSICYQSHQQTKTYFLSCRTPHTQNQISSFLNFHKCYTSQL